MEADYETQVPQKLTVSLEPAIHDETERISLLNQLSRNAANVLKQETKLIEQEKHLK